MIKTCKTAKVINGIVSVGDKVINVPQCSGSRAFYGIVKSIYRIDVGCTWLLIDSPKGELRYPSRSLYKGSSPLIYSPNV